MKQLDLDSSHSLSPSANLPGSKLCLAASCPLYLAPPPCLHQSDTTMISPPPIILNGKQSLKFTEVHRFDLQGLVQMGELESTTRDQGSQIMYIHPFCHLSSYPSRWETTANSTPRRASLTGKGISMTILPSTATNISPSL